MSNQPIYFSPRILVAAVLLLVVALLAFPTAHRLAMARMATRAPATATLAPPVTPMVRSCRCRCVYRCPRRVVYRQCVWMPNRI